MTTYFLARNDLKKAVTSEDKTFLAQVKIALDYTGSRSLDGQGCIAHILLKYDPSYATFAIADHVPIPQGERKLIALLFKSCVSQGDIEKVEVAYSENMEESVKEESQGVDNQDNKQVWEGAIIQGAE